MTAATASVRPDYPRTPGEVGPWAERTADAVNPLPPSLRYWVLVQYTRPAVVEALTVMGNLLVQGTGDPQALKDAATTWRQAVQRDEAMVAQLDATVHLSECWAGIAADSFRTLMAETRQWLVSATADHREVWHALANASVAVARTEQQLGRVVGNFLGGLLAAGRANQARWQQQAATIPGLYTVASEVVAAVRRELARARPDADKWVERARATATAAAATFANHGQNGRNRYESWARRGVRGLGIIQWGFGKASIGLLVGVGEQQNADGTHNDHLFLGPVVGVDPLLAGRVSEKWQERLGLTPVGHVPAAWGRVSTNGPNPEVTLSAEPSTRTTYTGVLTAGAVLPLLGFTGVDGFATYNPAAGDWTLTGHAYAHPLQAGDAKLGGSLYTGWNSTDGYQGTSVRPNVQGLTTYGPAGWHATQDGEPGVGGFSASFVVAREWLNQPADTSHLDNPAVNLGLPAAELLPLTVGSASTWLAQQNALADGAGRSLGEPIAQPPDLSLWNVLTGGTDYLPLTQPMRAQATNDYVDALIRHHDNLAAWGSAGTMAARGASQLSAPVVEALNSVYQGIPSLTVPAVPPVWDPDYLKFVPRM